MYGYLSRIFGPRVSMVLCALWYTLILVAVLVFSFEPPADFRYGQY